eukprot:1467766-Rhodomonas_salina.1
MESSLTPRPLRLESSTPCSQKSRPGSSWQCRTENRHDTPNLECPPTVFGSFLQLQLLMLRCRQDAAQLCAQRFKESPKRMQTDLAAVHST